ncbi:DUF192 domain-containing protein [Thauera sp. WB-2]|uniref:DUF192 domain-containing protein n=1 Tax=Thauera sp. WB-2 TaxID=2897772 RepID=UPI0022DE973E|nr:DUF192 domain-containing protein [Thauera sp. WB-2]WBL62837.1 DUF192 domain-containing protein [Thauera sp. WB-2]
MSVEPLNIRRAGHFLSRLRGLLGTAALAPGHALLITPCAAVHTAFMRYPIDVVFIDADERIAKVVEALPPWRATACASARHALELGAGEARRLGLVAGMRLDLAAGARPGHAAPHGRRERGATLVEFVVVGPLLLFILLVLMQYALLFHAKSQLNYATFEAARAGTVDSARPAAIRTAFDRAMTGYHGGGTTTDELAASRARALAESPFARIEILSPTKESFDDYHSPALATRLGLSARVIPNTYIAHLECPADRPSCSRNPATNASGQSLHDANLLKLRITYGIPREKQIPLAGPFMARASALLDPADRDTFRTSLLAQGRIPVVAHTVMRMQSPAIEAGNASIPGPGNAGKPSDPGPPPDGPTLPLCPVTDPACTSVPPPEAEPDEDPDEDPLPDDCNPLTDPGCGSPPSCDAPSDWLRSRPASPQTP